jgi:hypothetical protein
MLPSEAYEILHVMITLKLIDSAFVYRTFTGKVIETGTYE